MIPPSAGLRTATLIDDRPRFIVFGNPTEQVWCHSLPMSRLLITGLTGFVGETLCRYLPQSSYAGTYELCAPPPGFDITLPESVESFVTKANPDCVIHLAARSHVPTSFSDPAGTLAVNVIGTANLLQALVKTGFRGRMLYVGSADVYGLAEVSDLPVAETRTPMPRNPYAVSKAAAEMLCRQWHITHGLDVIIARPFNHTGPGQRPEYVLSGFAHDISAIAHGLRPARIEVGNIEVTRDFSDVRDVIDAYLTLLERGVPGEAYNVCSGREYLVADLLRQMLQQSGVEAEIVVDPQRLRPAEQRRMRGDHSKITAHAGWQPTRLIDDTLQDLLGYWSAYWRDQSVERRPARHPGVLA